MLAFYHRQPVPVYTPLGKLDGYGRLPKDFLVRCFGSDAGNILRRFVYPALLRVLPGGVCMGRWLVAAGQTLPSFTAEGRQWR